ncbi:MFS transporter [Candidatus Parcubacteria bacterium]|nr:MFS transporter [Candidatus Parcubacteria bacterium]
MSYLAVIRHGHFSKLWVAQILSLIAQNLLNFALIIIIYNLAQGTRFANVSVSLLVLSFGIPAIFFSAVAGIYVDHWDRKKVLVISNLLRGVLVLGYLVTDNHLLAILALTFTISSITQFFAPAEAAAIPLLVSKPALLGANALFVLTFYACFILGYSASAPVINLFGTSGPFYVAAGMFFGAALLTLWLPGLTAIGKDAMRWRQIFATTGRELQANWLAIRRNPNLYFPIVQLSLVQALVGILLALAPALSLALLKVELQNASHVLVIPTGIGMVLGVVVVGRLARRLSKITLISAGLLVVGAALSLLGLSGQLYRQVAGEVIASTSTVALVAGTLMLILGLMNALISVAAQTLLQESTADAMRGRVFGALYMMINLAATAPVFLAAIVADLLSVTQVVTAVGGVVFMFAVAQTLFLRRRSAAQLEKLGLKSAS